MSEPTYDELLLLIANVFRWDLDANGKQKPERLSSELRIAVGAMINRIPRALKVQPPRSWRLKDNIYDHVKARLQAGDVHEADVDPEERQALRDLVSAGVVETYKHRPNEGSEILTHWSLVASATR